MKNALPFFPKMKDNPYLCPAERHDTHRLLACFIVGKKRREKYETKTIQSGYPNS